MARIRTVKPDLWQNEEIATLSEAACLLSIGILNHADDEGYFKANPKLIKAALFPLREPSVSIPDMLTELSNIGYIALFEGSDGKQYGHVVNFKKHQTISRPTPSKIKPLLSNKENSVSAHGVLHVGKEQGKEQGKERKEECTKPPSASAPTDDSPTVIHIPLNDKTEFPIRKSKVDEWAELYPAIDVEQELRNMRGWCLNNPTRRKTKTGVLKFVNGWLAREQNNAKAKISQFPEPRYERL